MGTTTLHTPLAGPKCDADETGKNVNPLILLKFYTKATFYFYCKVGFRRNCDQASHYDLIVVHKTPN